MDRFVCDEEGYYVWAVELGDGFLTCYVKGRDAEGDRWMDSVGVDHRLHNPAVFHVGDETQEWVKEMYHPSWSHHFHVRTKGRPTEKDMEPYLKQIPPRLIEDVRALRMAGPKDSLRGPTQDGEHVLSAGD